MRKLFAPAMAAIAFALAQSAPLSSSGPDAPTMRYRQGGTGAAAYPVKPRFRHGRKYGKAR